MVDLTSLFDGFDDLRQLRREFLFAVGDLGPDFQRPERGAAQTVEANLDEIFVGTDDRVSFSRRGDKPIDVGALIGMVVGKLVKGRDVES